MPANLHNAADAVLTRGHKVDCRDVRDPMALGVNHQVQCDAMPAQVADPEQGGNDVLGLTIQHQDLVDLCI